MSNFFDDDDDNDNSGHLHSPSGSTTNGDNSFFTQPSPPRAAGRASSLSNRAGTSLRASSRARRDSPTLEEILGEEVGGRGERSVQRLIRAWNNEVAAPELLHFPVELVETVVRNLAERVSVVWLRGGRRELIREEVESAGTRREQDGGSRGVVLRDGRDRSDGEHACSPRPQVVYARADLQSAFPAPLPPSSPNASRRSSNSHSTTSKTCKTRKNDYTPARSSTPKGPSPPPSPHPPARSL